MWPSVRVAGPWRQPNFSHTGNRVSVNQPLTQLLPLLLRQILWYLFLYPALGFIIFELTAEIGIKMAVIAIGISMALFGFNHILEVTWDEMPKKLKNILQFAVGFFYFCAGAYLIWLAS